MSESAGLVEQRIERGEGTYPANERLRFIWIEPMIRWLKEQQYVTRQTALLDVGCGTGDFVGVMSPQVARAEGFDLDRDAVRVARSRFINKFYDRPDDLPKRTYDLVTVSSVIQYLGREELTPFLLLLRSVLKQNTHSFIVISDIIPPEYRSVPDAINSIVVSTRNGAAWAMVRHLVRSVLRMQKVALTKWSPEQLASAASAAGLSMTTLRQNLTPSRQRYSCVLRVANTVDGD